MCSDSKDSSQLNGKIANKSTPTSTVGRGTQRTRQEKSVPDRNKAGISSIIIDLATPSAEVSAFCQAVISRIVPNDFLGNDDVQMHNKSHLLKSIDSFVRLRRFESMSLHEVMQDMKVS